MKIFQQKAQFAVGPTSTERVRRIDARVLCHRRPGRLRSAAMEDQSSPAETEEVRLPAGTRLGKYEIIRLLGAGGMGAVYEGLHTEMGKRVAIKTLSPSVAEIPGARQRFVREAQLTSRVRHPHIVDVSDVGTDGGRAYIVMELLRGEDLSQRLSRTGAIAPRELVDIMLPVCSALVAAHGATIVHRDLKPQNIFLATSPHGVQPKVLDFGISKSGDALTVAGALTRTGSVMGTPFYLAPEQIQDARAAGPSSDQYAIGVILYECLAGRRPFEGESLFAVFNAIVSERPVPLRERRGDLPPGLAEIVGRAMSASQAERFPSVRELGLALLPFASPKIQMIWDEAFSAAGGDGENRVAPLQSPVLFTPTPPPVTLTPAPRMQATPGPRMPTTPTMIGAAGRNGARPLHATDGFGATPAPPTLLGRARLPLVMAIGVAVVAIGLVTAFALWPRSAPPAPPSLPPVAVAPPPVAPPPVTPPIEQKTPPAEPKIAPVEMKTIAPEPTRAAAPKHRHASEPRRKVAAPEHSSSPPRNLNPNGAPVID
jgi:serine/threonine protein kinase